jgi:hypothetical protein
MFTAQQYRAKASEYEVLANGANTPAELAEYRSLHQNYLSLAENLDWLSANGKNTIHSETNGAKDLLQSDRRAAHAEEERILRSLGAAVMLKWNTIPTTLQRELFQAASSVRGTPSNGLKVLLAHFLHDHKNDVGSPQK